MAQASIRAVITAEDRASSVLSGVGGSFGKLAGAMAVGQLAAQALSKAISVVTDNVGAAVKRVDTLSNASRVFENMGFAGDAVKASMDGLKQSILGLPTPLDAAVRGMQMIASSTGDIGRAQKIFSAMNNAILGFGGSAAMVENSVLQLSQAFSNGKIDAQTWNSMMQSGLGPTLNALAKKMKLTTGQLKDGLSEGAISVQKFQDSLIDLDKNGGGGLKSLQQIAKDSTAGINTGMENAKTAMTRGMANVIQAIGPEKISGAFTKVGEVVEKAFNRIATIVPPIMEGIKTLVTGDFKSVNWPKAMGIQEDSPLIVALFEVRKAFIETFNFIKTTGLAVWGGLKQAIDFLTPSLLALWATVQTQLWPTLQKLWKEVIEPLAPVIGVILVGAVYALINGINIAIQVFSWLMNNVLLPLKNFIVALPVFFATAFAWIADRVNWLKNHFWEAVGFIIGFFATLPVKLLALIVLAILRIGAYLQSINWVNFFNGLIGAWARAWQIMWEAVVGLHNRLVRLDWGAIGRSVGNAIIGFVEGSVNGALSGIPGAPKVRLPRFASGVQNFAGGMAVVGEQGPEVVQLPRGSNVIPNHQIGGAASTTVNISLNVGVYAGTEIEKRKLAKDLFSSLQEVANQRNTTVAAMMGA